MATSTQNQKYYSDTSTNGGSTSNTTSHTEGHSSSTTTGSSDTKSSSNGGANSISSGKTYASGQVASETQNKFNQYNQDYVQSDNVTNAYNNLQAALQNKPTFESSYADKLSQLYDQIMNRDKFNYNFNEDAMYQLYKDQYSQMGQQAMQDTMGQAAALTGGYGSSYAQTVGQQQYQNYLTQLNNMIPELRNQAYQEYQAEGEDLLNKYNLTNTAYNNEYGMYRDSMNDWQTDRAFNQSAYADERNFDLSKYQSDRNYWQSEFWNEKNAEQSNTQRTDQTNWNESKSHTDSTSHTETDYWENGSSETKGTNWSNSTNSGWQDTTSTQANSGSGSSGSGTKSQTAAQTYNRAESLDSYSSERRGSDIIQLAEYLDGGEQKTSSSSKKTYMDQAKDMLKDLLENGTKGSNGTKIYYDEQDIANMVNRAMELNNKDYNNRTSYSNYMNASDVIGWLYGK